MANTTVTNVSEMLLTNVTAGAKAGEQKISEDGGFTKVMNNAKDATTDNKPKKAEEVGKASRTVVETPKKSEIKAEETVKRDPVANEDDMTELTEEVAKEVSKIFNKITEVLGVSEEELTTAMENLGLTMADLLDPISVKDLCMNLTGIEDSISLLTNAEVYESVKEIVQTAETAENTITAQFGITKEDFSEIKDNDSFEVKVEAAVEKLGNNAEAENLNITETAVFEIKDDTMPKQDMDVDDHADLKTVFADNKDTNEAVRTDAATVTVEVTGKPEPKQEAKTDTAPAEVTSNDPVIRTGESVTETFKATVKSEESNLKGDSEGFEHASRFVETETVNVTPQQTQVVNTEVNNLGEIVETVTTYSNEEANSIMSQVTQSIRVNFTPDTTSMEMQLHPASLGTVNLNIASTNGVVTAHILVENEAVKAALESQLIALQQTFDEQGQKVEAVEVSVANYDLNKGTDPDTDGQGGDRKTGNSGKVGGRRRINLNDLDEEGLEDLNEDERIAADMMARSGNSVDYQA